MGIRVAGRSGAGSSFALTAATGDGSALEQSNTGSTQMQDAFQYGISSNAGCVPMRDQFQYEINPIGYELGAVRIQDTFQYGIPANTE